MLYCVFDFGLDREIYKWYSCQQLQKKLKQQQLFMAVTSTDSVLWATVKNKINCSKCQNWTWYHHHTPQPFYGPFSGTTRVSRCQKRTSGLYMVQGKFNRGRHTDHPAGRHSIRTNQCPPPPSRHFLQTGCPSCRLTNSVKALKELNLIVFIK